MFTLLFIFILFYIAEEFLSLVFKLKSLFTCLLHVLFIFIFFLLIKIFCFEFNVLVIFLMFGGREITGNVWRRISESRWQDQ